jgi:low temperature requirement protein LtrA
LGPQEVSAGATRSALPELSGRRAAGRTMAKQTNLWWGPPKKFSDRTNERKISWLELFYDLAYVAVISQLTHHLAERPDWGAVGWIFLLFALMFWSWVNGSQYYDLHGSDGIRTRVFTFWQMLAVSAVAISIPGVFEGHHRPFAIAFLVIQGLITYLWWSVGLYDPSHRVLNFPYSVNYCLAFLFIFFSLFCGPAIAKGLWIAATALDITPGLLGARLIVGVLKERGQVFTASAALVERFGLFTIIILAECILGTVSGITEVKHQQPAAWAAAVLAILIAFLIWSLYFDMTSEQETKEGYGYMLSLIYLHYPLVVSLSIVGACTKVMLLSMGTGVSATVQWMFCVAVATILVTVVGLTRIMREEEEDRAYIQPVSRLLLVIAVMILLVPLLGRYLGTLPFLGLIACLLLFPVLIGIKSWARYKFQDSAGAAGIPNENIPAFDQTGERDEIPA